MITLVLTACAAPQTGRLMSQVGEGFHNNKNKKYIIIPADPKIDRESFEFNEYSNYIAKAMQHQGFLVSKNINDAEAIVFLGYSVSNPKTAKYTVNTPIFGQTGIQSYSTQGTFNPYSGNYSQNTTFNPQYGITGYIPEEKTVIYYTKIISLDAFSVFNQNNNISLGQKMWNLNIVYVDSNAILRDVFPAMIFGAKEYIGVDSKRSIEFELKNDNDLNSYQ